MARNEHLPIYKAAYDLCLWLEQVVRGFSRYHKYAIGSDLRSVSRRILRLVVRANARSDKTPVLLDLREEVEQMKALMRLCNDAGGFSGLSAFEHGMRLVVEIAKQNEGWLRSQASREQEAGAAATASKVGRSELPPGAPAAAQGRGQNRGSASSLHASAPAPGVP